MIKLGTVFSGIGAIEHALERMQVPHKVMFACDNGDVDLEIKTIDDDFNLMSTTIKSLKKEIAKIKVKTDAVNMDYAEQLAKMLDGAESSLQELNDMIVVTDTNAMMNAMYREAAFEEAKNLIQVEYEKCTASKRKKYKDLLVKFNKGNLSNCETDYYIIKTLYILEEDKVNVPEECCALTTFVNEYKDNAKKIVKKGQDIKERINMLYDKIFYLEMSSKLASLEDYSEKKKLVDALYSGKESKNKVRISYLANYELNPKHYHWNVAFLDGKQYAKNVDLFVGGSPCQSFSLVGKQRGLEDTRGTLFYEYARLIKEIQPKVFIYENVRAILSNDGGKTWEKMKEVFRSLGYNVYYEVNGKPSVLNSKDYGIPQNRERMFVVGFRNDLLLEKEFSFPAPIPLTTKMKDYLLDNVSGIYYLPKKGVEFVTSEKNLNKRYTQIDGEIALCQKKNQQFNWHGDFVFVEENKDMETTMKDLEKYFLSEKVEKYVLATGTKNFYSRPKTDLDVARPLLTTMHKMHRAGVDNYVTTSGRLRKLTPRECLRLMGFCDSFKNVVSDTAMYQQAGNSIVVDVLIHIMQAILESYPSLGQEDEQ